MRRSAHSLSILLASALFLPLAAGAAGLGFLKETPLYYFTDADNKLMNEAVMGVLNDADAEARREWTNPKNGYSGRVQGTGKFRSSDGLDCRRVKLWTQARGVESETMLPVCRDAKGAWRLASGKELTKA